MRKRIEFQGFLQIGRVSREFFHCFIFELTTGKDGWIPPHHSAALCKIIDFPQNHCTVESRICPDSSDITASVRGKLSARCKVGIRI